MKNNVKGIKQTEYGSFEKIKSEKEFFIYPETVAETFETTAVQCETHKKRDFFWNKEFIIFYFKVKNEFLRSWKWKCYTMHTED